MLLCVAYAAMYFAPSTPLRDFVPAHKAAWRYAGALACAYAAAAAGAFLAGCGVAAGGCVWAFVYWLLDVCLGPLLYVSFVRSVVRGGGGADGLDADLLMYAEMRDAGVLDDDF